MPGYVLRSGFVNSRPLLIQFLKAFYQESFPENQKLHERAGDYANYFIDIRFSAKNPLFWVQPSTAYDGIEQINLYTPVEQAMGCLFFEEGGDVYKGQSDGYISFMYVDPSYRRQGIGTAMVEFAKSWARLQGYPQLTLDVLSANLPALGLYQKLGFSPKSFGLAIELEAASDLGE
jgi:ribosomal protein S18 acetylase RimI-like enzyme